MIKMAVVVYHLQLPTGMSEQGSSQHFDKKYVRSAGQPREKSVYCNDPKFWDRLV